ncbi:hypothetical protein SPV_2544 [Streptococcus pneumoniae]|nr:hypothetical protein SPV_2544 [Streptococcus pneumoniae]
MTFYQAVGQFVQYKES